MMPFGTEDRTGLFMSQITLGRPLIGAACLVDDIPYGFSILQLIRDEKAYLHKKDTASRPYRSIFQAYQHAPSDYP